MEYSHGRYTRDQKTSRLGGPAKVGQFVSAGTSRFGSHGAAVARDSAGGGSAEVVATERGKKVSQTSLMCENF